MRLRPLLVLCFASNDKEMPPAEQGDLAVQGIIKLFHLPYKATKEP